jgi:hypothetical protein
MASCQKKVRKISKNHSHYRAPAGCNGEMSAFRGAPTGSCFVLTLTNLLVKCTAVW